MKKFDSYSIDECYSNLKSSDVYSINTHQECYLHVSHKFDGKISRCGECLEIFGPSNKPYKCQVTGFFDFNNTIPFDTKTRMLLTNHVMFNSVTTVIKYHNEQYTQITISEVDCEFPVKPTAIVKDSLIENHWDISFINTNQLVKFIDINNITYDMNQSTLLPTFTVPKSEDDIVLKLVSQSGDALKLLGMNQTGKYLFKNKFPKKPYKHCYFLPNINVMLSDESIDYFKWVFYRIDHDWSMHNVEIVDNGYLFRANGNFVTLGLGCPMSFNFYSSFYTFEGSAIINGTFQYSSSFVGIGNQNSAYATDSVIRCVNMPSKWYIKDNILKFKVSIPRSCFGLGLLLHFI